MAFVAKYFPRLSKFARSLYLIAFSDRRIARYLAELFESQFAPKDAEGLRFYVRDRTVMIYGTLYHPFVHHRVLRMTSQVFGVQAIVDRIHVVRDVEEHKWAGERILRLNDQAKTTRFLPA